MTRREVAEWTAGAVGMIALTWFAFASHIVFDGERTPVCRPAAMAGVCAYSRWAFMAGFIATTDAIGAAVCPASSPQEALARYDAGESYCWAASAPARISFEPAPDDDDCACPEP